MNTVVSPPIGKDVEALIVSFIQDHEAKKGDFERFKDLLNERDRMYATRFEDFERRLLSTMNERDARWADQIEAIDKRTRREHELHSRRLAELGYRMGHVETEVAAHTTEIEKIEERVSEKIAEIERDSGEWKKAHLEEKKEDLKVTREKLHWYERQWLIWIVGFIMFALGAALSFLKK